MTNGSFIDPEEEAAKETAEKQGKTGAQTPNPPEKTLFTYLEQIIAEFKNNTKALEKLATAMEKLAFDKKVDEVKRTVEKKTTTVKPVKPEQPKKVEKPESGEPEINAVQKVKNTFTAELADLLIFEDIDDHVKIRTKKFLESDNFAKIAAVVRNIGGEYISAGKDTHFKVKKTK